MQGEIASQIENLVPGIKGNTGDIHLYIIFYPRVNQAEAGEANSLSRTVVKYLSANRFFRNGHLMFTPVCWVFLLYQLQYTCMFVQIYVKLYEGLSALRKVRADELCFSVQKILSSLGLQKGVQRHAPWQASSGNCC